MIWRGGSSRTACFDCSKSGIPRMVLLLRTFCFLLPFRHTGGPLRRRFNSALDSNAVSGNQVRKLVR
jgi:hypothetical protein